MNDGNGMNSGHCRIYEWAGGTWRQLGTDKDGEAAGDFSGTSLSLSGDGSRVCIGAPLNDGNGMNSGHVRIYNLDALVDTFFQVISVCDSVVRPSDTVLFSSFAGSCDSLVITSFEDTCFGISVESQARRLGFRAAPNPFEGEVRFLLNLHFSPSSEIYIYNSQGQLVKSIDIPFVGGARG